MPQQKNDKLEEKYLQLQIAIQQINQIQQQIANLNAHFIELNNFRNNLNDLNNIKENTESFVPLGFNVFLKSKIKDTKELLVNVGSNIFITKSVEETNSFIDSQIEEIEFVLKELDAKLIQLEQSGQLLQSEILQMANK